VSPKTIGSACRRWARTSGRMCSSLPAMNAFFLVLRGAFLNNLADLSTPGLSDAATAPRQALAAKRPNLLCRIGLASVSLVSHWPKPDLSGLPGQNWDLSNQGLGFPKSHSIKRSC
jgi:hypothetical protein